MSLSLLTRYLNLLSLARLGIHQDRTQTKTGSVYLTDLLRALRPDPDPAAPAILRAENPEVPPDRPALVLIHGHYWVDNIERIKEPLDRAFLFEPFRQDARYLALLDRYRVFMFLYPTHLDYGVTARRLKEAVEAVLPAYQGRRDVTWIAHSMGGLVARHALQLGDLGRRTRTLFTLATPHRGTILASFVAAHPGLHRRIGLLGMFVQQLAKNIWRPTPGMAGMAHDNHDGKITSDEESVMGLTVNRTLARLNSEDPYLDRLVCVMGKVSGNWMPGRNFFDQIPRWYLGRQDPPLKYLDPLITPESGLAEGLPVRSRILLEGLDHETIMTNPRSVSWLFRALLGSGRRRLRSIARPPGR